MSSLILHLVLVTCLTKMVTTQDFQQPEGDSCATCEHKYTYRGTSRGIFTSPKFPDNYPERTTCCFFFHARDEGRVKIEFDFFDLEPSDHECRYDYIEISSINTHGYKEQPKSVFCGTAIPPVYISTHSKLEIIFHSDVTTNARGFIGHYEFLNANWSPFDPSTIGCGPGYLTGHGGTLQSPNFPLAYPSDAGCTWVIKTMQSQRILVSFTAMDLVPNAKCHVALMIFDGFTTRDKEPEFKYCGRLSEESILSKEYLSKSDRIVIRFESSLENSGKATGFKLSWTAVTIAMEGACDGFQCAREGTGSCDQPGRLGLCKQHHYCIDASLHCNEAPNCGAADSSDEKKCLVHIMKYVGYIGGPLIVIIIIVVIVFFCCRKRCRPGVRYSVPKEQSLSHSMTHSMTHSFVSSAQSSNNVPVRSLDHSPRSSCVMYTTSFTDCAVNDNANSNINTNSDKLTVSSFTNSLPTSSNSHNSTKSINETPPEDEVVKPAYKGHHKRPSYHMMRELCYEDGNVVIADI